MKTTDLEYVRKFMEMEGYELSGEKGFGDEFVKALKELGVVDGDEIEIFSDDFYTVYPEHEYIGTINGQEFDEDMSSAEFKLMWI